MSKQKWRRRKVPRWLVRCAPHQAIGGLIPPDVCFGAGCRPEDLISRRWSSPCYRGTEGSNPSPSTSESSANLTFGAHPDEPGLLSSHSSSALRRAAAE